MSFLSIARKDIKILFRDRSALVFIFGLPLIFTFIFGSVFGGKNSEDSRPPLKVRVVNLDQGKMGEGLIDNMRKIGLVALVDPVGVGSLTEKVKNGDSAVGVIIPADFSKQVEAEVDVVKSGGKPEPVHLKVLTDPAQPQISGIAQGAIFGAVQQVVAPLLGGKAELPTLIALDVSSPQAAVKPSVGDTIMPGFMVYFVFFMANGVASSLLTERTDGTLRRMLSAPVSRAQILVGKLLARGLMGLIQMVLLFFVGMAFLHLTVGSSPLGLVLTALATIFAATGLGLLIATFG